ncbi:MAG TPA: bifunctional phosphoribosylaminoimidazolecarboxamide formyltransferase/IMP cyclohydrolase [Saprospiraceae bacterium]|nr:bifunctional phosphoribosylaminoimidazolecarboxamide formyltransferase/IMP cyclohydrolase [Saprospiraceae bacterium]
MSEIKISTALISVYNKEGLAPIIKELQNLQIKIYSTGGTYQFIEKMGIPVESVEDLTGYPSILDGRVKTLHPKIFGGILARGEDTHLEQLEEFKIPRIDLVVVDLYPFEETLQVTNDPNEIIEKIDIGGVSLIRAGAKNFIDIVTIASREDYGKLMIILNRKQGVTYLDERKELARRAFMVTSHYDVSIYQYFNQDILLSDNFKMSKQKYKPLRYGENPHQKACFYGNLESVFEKYGGKDLSYNNLVDIDAALSLIQEFDDDEPVFAIIKHTNPCGLAIGKTVHEAWNKAFACDPVSSFGGIFITNARLDLETAGAIKNVFYEVLIAPDYDEEALTLLKAQKNRIILKVKARLNSVYHFKSLLNGVIVQEEDSKLIQRKQMFTTTIASPKGTEWEDLALANICVKHLKSNAIAIVKNKQMIGIGCGQTSRVDACKLAIDKAHRFEFDSRGAVMASDAFFPFPDCVELGYKAGISAVIQPGGSLKDQLSIDFCNEHGMAMVFTSYRHFKH